MANWSVNNDLINGNDMFLYLVDISAEGAEMNGTSAISASQVVAYATSCSLEVNADTLDTTSKFSCRWNAVRPGNASYTVSADALYCKKANAAANSAYTIDDLFDLMIEGKNIGWVIAQDKKDPEECEPEGPDGSKPYYWGEGAITSLSINAGNNEIVSSSISITGSGPVNYEG